MEYQALFEPAEEGGFVVTFPDFETGVTQGDTDQEAREMAADVLALVIESYIQQNKPLPLPAHRRGRKYRPVSLPALQAAKVELYRQLTSSGMRKSDLARRMKASRASVDRLYRSRPIFPARPGRGRVRRLRETARV